MTNFVIGIPSVTKTITVRRPGREEEQFTADIRVRDVDAQDKLADQQSKGKLKGNKHIREDVLSVGGIDDVNGQPVESTDKLIDALFQDPYAMMGLIRAWNEVQRGLPEEEAKN